MTTIQLFQILKPRLGERETGALVEFVETKIQENNKEMHEMNLKTLATKEDQFVLREELGAVRAGIAAVRSELKEEIAAFRLEFKSEIARLEIKMGDLKSDLIRWMFALFVTLMLAILGLYFKH